MSITDEPITDELRAWFAYAKGRAYVAACEVEELARVIDRIDAAHERAIEATLGRGTCEMEYVSDFMSWHCKACGQMDMAPRNPKPRYCKWCGRKVVDPTTNDVDCPNCGRRVVG